MTQELIDLIALRLTSGIGNGNIKTLISYKGNASEILKSRKSELLKVPGIGDKTISEILGNNLQSRAEKILKDCEKLGVKTLSYLSPEFPKRLKHIVDAPIVLYVLGNGDLNPKKTVSIVGTRNATNYGKSIVEEVVRDLEQYQTTVISGLAYGIDIESHRCSLECNLPTFAVLAGGLDSIYPRTHDKIAKQMMQSGGLISEYPPGTKPEAHLFPARNRVIAGLGDATIIVEAAEKGGALITAELADSYSRPVFAVPGNLDRAYSKGCNNLIRIQKAVMFTGVRDLVYYLNWDLEPTSANKERDLSILSTEEKKVPLKIELKCRRLYHSDLWENRP